jgi:Tfp pilus assembly protein PilV
MNAAQARWSRGASLIEVMLAVALTAVTALGLIATQLWIARDTRAAALRERAALLSDALAEAARAPAGGDTALRQWSDRAASLLPKGDASISEHGQGVSFARVIWSAVAKTPASVQVIDKPDSCGDLPVAAGLSCSAVAFVK